MSRTSARFLTALLGVWLLLDAGNRATISHAQDADFGIFFLRLIESAPAKGDASPPVLVFAVKPEGQAVLMVTSRAPADPSSRVDESDVIWQQTGTLSRIELNLLKTAVGDLAKIPDQHWPDKDYALDLYPIEDLAASKRLLVSSAMKPGSAADRATLDNAMRTILKVRKRFEPLVVFKWFGGFRRRASRLTIRPDGALTYEDLLRRTNVAGTVTQSQLDLVLRQIHNATSLALPPVVDKTCADCWAYSLLTLSDDGLKTADFDQVALEGGPQSLKTLVRLLADLSDEEALVHVTLTPLPTATPTRRPTATKRPSSTPTANGTAKPSPTAIRWELSLAPGDRFQEVLVLKTSDDVLIGAVKQFQLQPGQAPQECVAFVIRGPMALMLGVFGPGWTDQEHGWTDAMIDARLQEGVTLLSRYCDREKITIRRVP